MEPVEKVEPVEVEPMVTAEPVAVVGLVDGLQV